jgi:DNA polymerase-3 subunit delta
LLRPFLGEAGAVAPWELTDAIDRGDVTGAIERVHRLVPARHPLEVMAILQTHYRRMLRLDGAPVADETAAAALLGMTGSTFPAKKALAQTKKLGHSGVARAVTLLADADLALKGELEWSGVLVLEVLVARLARLAPRPAASSRRGS